jgi:hypothetical protein
MQKASTDVHKAIGVLLRESMNRLDAAKKGEGKVIAEFIEQVIILMEMEKARNFGEDK